MGFLSATKADTIESHAERAWSEGRQVFVPLLSTSRGTITSSGPVSGWAEMIEAIESVGWHMAEWSVSATSTGAVAVPIFRR